MNSNTTLQPYNHSSLSFMDDILTVTESDVFASTAAAIAVGSSDDFTSDELEDACRKIIDLGINSVLSYFGILTNFLNIIVFAKIGFQETINISFTGIALWDLLRCFCFALIRIYGPMSLTAPAEAESWKNITSVNAGWTYTIAGYVSSALAGYVAVERCICVVKPFTVKFLLTPRTVIVTGITLSFIVTGSFACAYALMSFERVFSPKYNESIYVFKLSSFAEDHPSMADYTNYLSAFWAISSLVVTCVSTAVISHFLRRASVFRSSITNMSTSGGRSDTKNVQLSVRDKKVIKMMLVIITVYIVCNLPRIFYVLEYQNANRLTNTIWVYIYFMSMFDLVNASTNIIVYYFMSTVFKKAFKRHILCSCSDKVQ